MHSVEYILWKQRADKERYLFKLRISHHALQGVDYWVSLHGQ